MTSLTLTKNNLWEVLTKLHSQISESGKKIVLNYEVVKDEKKSNFLKSFIKNNISLNEEPLSFQQKIRNEWK